MNGAANAVRKYLRYEFLPETYLREVRKSQERYGGFYKANLFSRTEFRRQQKKMWAALIEAAGTGIPCIVVACEDDAFVVQVLSTPGKKGSFIEAVVRPADPLYSFFKEKVGMLNLAGEGEDVEGLGANIGRGHYNVYIDSERHAQICNTKSEN